MQLIESSLIAGSIWKLFKSRTTSVESSPKARKFLLKPFWKQAEFSSKLSESRINCQNTRRLPQNQRFQRAPLLCFWLAVSDLAKVTIIMRPHLNLDGQYFWQNSVESEWKELSSKSILTQYVWIARCMGWSTATEVWSLFLEESHSSIQRESSSAALRWEDI